MTPAPTQRSPQVPWVDVAMWAEDAFHRLREGDTLLTLMTLAEEGSRQSSLAPSERKPEAIAAMRELLKAHQWTRELVDRAWEEIVHFLEVLEDLRARSEPNLESEAPLAEGARPEIPGEEGSTLLRCLRLVLRHEDLVSAGVANEHLNRNFAEWEQGRSSLATPERRYSAVVAVVTALDSLLASL